MEGTGAPSGAPSSPREAQRLKLLRNLDKANIVRVAKKHLREAIKAGDVDDLEVLRGDSPYEEIVTQWPVERLMLLMRRIGRSRSTDILDFARIRPHTKLRNLTYAQREQLCKLVADTRTKGGTTAT